MPYALVMQRRVSTSAFQKKVHFLFREFEVSVVSIYVEAKFYKYQLVNQFN